MLNLRYFVAVMKTFVIESTFQVYWSWFLQIVKIVFYFQFKKCDFILGEDLLVENATITSVKPFLTSFSPYERNTFSYLTNETIFVAVVASFVLIFCILIFLILISLNLKRSERQTCRCKYSSHGSDSQSSSNLSKYLKKSQVYSQSPHVLSTVHCPCLLRCCIKDYTHSSLNSLPQVDFIKNNPNSHRILSFNNSNSYPQKPIDSATTVPVNVSVPYFAIYNFAFCDNYIIPFLYCNLIIIFFIYEFTYELLKYIDYVSLRLNWYKQTVV